MNLISQLKRHLNTRLSLFILLIGIAISIGIYYKHKIEVDNLKAEFQSSAQTQAMNVGHTIEHTLHMLNQGLLTIARLPRTGQIDRHGKTLDTNTKQSIQEIYNYLYSNIALSEVYIVPIDFNPDLLDDTTGKPQIPSITFDEFIVGKNSRNENVELKKDDLKEIEIEEYHVMWEQIKWLKEKYPTSDTVDNLNFPGISSKEVITCDNTQYNHELPNDKDRSGLVYSVPVYNNAGNFSAIVSGVILTNTIRKLLPSNRYSITNIGKNYFIHHSRQGAWQYSMDKVIANLPNNDLVFSNVIPLSFSNDKDRWSLWVGVNNQEFWSLPQVKSEQRAFLISITMSTLLTIGMLLITGLQRRQQDLIRNQNAFLEKTVHDRTLKLSQANKQLEQANKQKSEFLQGMSHELRTPLNAIIGYSELVEESAEEQGIDLIQQDAQKITISARHLLSLINEVLDIAKIESGKTDIYEDQFDARSLVNEIAATIKPLIDKNQNELQVNITEDKYKIITDRKKLKQILLNLVSNAAKFTSNGTIKISLSHIISNNTPFLEFIIEDTGIGMTAEQLDVIFEAFVQANPSINRDYGGTGLGLALCKQLCALLNGSICANSKFGIGSSFIVRIPIQLSKPQLARQA